MVPNVTSSSINTWEPLDALISSTVETNQKTSKSSQIDFCNKHLLILSLENTLISCKKGQEIQIRPHVDFFLREISRYYNVCVLTNFLSFWPGPPAEGSGRVRDT